MKLLLLFRTPKPHFFSIEKVYQVLNYELDKRIQIQRAFLPGADLSIVSLWRNIGFIKRFKADIFHITGEIYYLALFLPSSRLVITIHDCYYARHKSFRGWLIRKFWLEKPVKRSRYVVAISENTKKEIMELTGCEASKIVVIHNPLNPAFQFRLKEFNNVKPVILHVGTRWNKNLERVADALNGIPCLLHIIGDITEKQREALERNRIEFISSANLSEEELVRAYRESDLVSFPSLNEGFGLPIIEAQAVGRPVLTSTLSPMKDVAGEGACLADPFDITDIRTAFTRIIEDSIYRETLIRNGLENVKRFNPEKVAEQYYQLYKRFESANEKKQKRRA